MARLEVPVQLRWSDMDAYAHVNNVEMLRLLEEARIEVFWRHPESLDGVVPDGARATAVLDAGPGALTSTLVARQEIQYLRPLPYRRAPVVIELWLGHLGGASIDVCYEVRDAPTSVEGSQVYARATTTIVLVDSATGAPRRLTPEERAVWEPYLEDPVVIRRRA
ncbi:acyl-CoA thioesterase [Cellulomonas wangsupingiae]|uniref:Acyl-CoA thioesterase n=1 Tax=Cellulomonas wangsupingiae TaxID=2968085 RepID=A0ABY5K8N2_9CELL|nr:thioesterase family protein [Cellulomonas wangsupingiae]MCC2334616.1 acyl-CoA thioesterase [Cellulomonas wangsupingiae]MCM0638663.1 acyl-CoA thioesterase [Cellulomonas wangsupingiae]UUI66418.1 acyl-CoA thioesterase [Cellulomonas wangsupingiae]